MSTGEFDLQQFDEYRALEARVLDLQAENEGLKAQIALLVAEMRNIKDIAAYITKHYDQKAIAEAEK